MFSPSTFAIHNSTSHRGPHPPLTCHSRSQDAGTRARALLANATEPGAIAASEDCLNLEARNITELSQI
jgi:hypothetical protein